MHIPTELQQISFNIYLRRSSDDNDHQVESLPSQKAVLTKLAKEKHLKIGRIVEESMSAKQPGRPIFMEEIKRIEAGVIQGLVIWDLSRASRNPVDSGALSWLLQKEILKAIITPHKIYLSEDNVLLLNVEFGMANQYLRDLSKNVKRGLHSKVESGWRPGLPPEGYLNDRSVEKGSRTIITDTKRFVLIRKMWDLILTENYTVPQILKIVNEEWKYTMRKHKKLGGTPMSRSGLYRIFTNPFYYGWFEYGGEWYEGKHKKMITQAEYDKVQSILGRRGKQRPKTREFAFTGMVRCGECNAMVTAEEKINRYGQRYIYYHCTKRVNPKCTQKSIELGDLEEQIDYLLSKIEIPESFKDWAIEHLNELHDKEAKDQTMINKSVDEAYSDCIERINNLIKLKISSQNSDGSLNEFIDGQLTPLLKEKKSLMDKKGNVDERIEKWLELSTKTFNFACYARMRFYKGSLAEKKEILQTIGSNFILEGKTLRLQVPKPFVLVEEAKNEIDEIRARLEPQEKVDLTSQMLELFAQSSTLRRERDSNSRRA
ncbi:hypothetical protein BH09PAT1_BH09PAT1_4020 [soil metagenome]